MAYIYPGHGMTDYITSQQMLYQRELSRCELLIQNRITNHSRYVGHCPDDIQFKWHMRLLLQEWKHLYTQCRSLSMRTKIRITSFLDVINIEYALNNSV